MGRRVTREWGRRSRKGGYRRSHSLGSRILLPLCAVVAMWFVWQGWHGAGPQDLADASPEMPAENTGGGVDYSGEVSDILAGNVLSIPVDEPIVLEEHLDDEVPEADIAQETTAVAISTDALEAVLTAIDERHGNGVATSEWVDEEFQHVVVATLPDPPEGYSYEGWLVRSKPFDFFSTGTFIQHADDLKWYLVWTDAEDRSDYRKVIVTLEAPDGDPAPGDHVLEGVY